MKWKSSHSCKVTSNVTISPRHVCLSQLCNAMRVELGNIMEIGYFFGNCVPLSYMPEDELYLESWQMGVISARSRRVREIFLTFVDLKL